MLDCETPLGKMYIEEQYKTQKILEGMGFVVVSMSKKSHHSDAIIAKQEPDGLFIYGVAEIKTRRMAGDVPLTRRYLEENGYLITYEKIKTGCDLAFKLGVPFFLIVRVLGENFMAIWRITDEEGLFLFEFDRKVSRSQKTCNGGVAVRDNAYLPIDKAKLFDCVHRSWSSS